MALTSLLYFKISCCICLLCSFFSTILRNQNNIFYKSFKEKNKIFIILANPNSTILDEQWQEKVLFHTWQVNYSYLQWIIHIIQALNNIMLHLSWHPTIGIKYTFCKDFAIMHLICSYVLRFWWSSGLMSYTRLRSLSMTLSWFFFTLSLIWSSLRLVCSSILAWKSSLEPMCWKNKCCN